MTDIAQATPVESGLIRQRGGDIVHRSTCRYVTPNGVPWNWAEGKTLEGILKECCAHGVNLHFCRCCFPELHVRGLVTLICVNVPWPEGEVADGDD